MTVAPASMAYGAMLRPELDAVLDWAALEGWNPGLADAEAFFASDPGGFFVARREGVPVAAICVVNHTKTFAFLGLYICKPEARGKGIGFGLWNMALAHAGPRGIGLDGVADQQANYAASGFVLASRTERFTGCVDAAQPLDAVRPMDVGWITEMEAAACGYDKPAFMGAWLAPSPDRLTLVLPDRSGFATVRACRQGAKIGPLVATDLGGAKALLHGAAGVFSGPLTLDLPVESDAMTDYCRSIGMSCGFATARMYRGAAPKPGAHVRAVGTLELG